MSGLALVAALWLGAVPARAADVSDVDRLYFHRNEGGDLDENIKRLDALLAGSPADPELLWRKGRSLMRRGERQPRKADKLADYLQSEDLLKRAIELTPSSVDAHYWYGVAMGRRGEAQGVLHSLFLIKPIRKEMNETLRLDPSHGGAHRVLGEILWQVPGFAGGDKKQALAEFETSVRLNPKYTANYQPLAEAYEYFGLKDDAVKTLKQVEQVKDPMDPGQYPDDLADARKTLEKLSR